MRLSKSLKDKLMDVRVRDKFVSQGKVTQKELDQYLESLKDDAVKATYTGKSPSTEQESAQTTH